jgi:long-chain acyl-CoA synthetase
MVVNPTTKAEKLTYILNNSGAAALVASADKLATLGDLTRSAPGLRAVIPVGPAVEKQPGGTATLADLLSRHAPQQAPPNKQCIDVDLASLVYTSGSTGNPKGVMLTHLNFVTAANAITGYLHNTSQDVILNVLPLASVYGLGQLLMGLKIGGTVLLAKSFAYSHALLRQIAAEKVTGFGLVPMIAAMLLNLDLSKHDLSSLRYVTNASAPLPTEHLQKLRKLLPRVSIYSMYGQTECIRASYLEPKELDRRPASVGCGMPNQEQWLVDDQGNRVGPGVIGELVVRGAHVMKGYWGLPEETRRALRPGPLPGESVLHTGDLFRMDEDGHLYFVSRKDDIIKSRGEKVSPKEVEDVLHRLEGVEEAAVIGVPDPVLGQAVKAIIVARQGVQLTQAAVLRHCADQLEDFMVPKAVEFRAELPKTEVGKIRKLELRTERM